MITKPCIQTAAALFLAVAFMIGAADPGPASAAGPANALSNGSIARLPDTPQADHYLVIGENDFSAGYGRVRKGWCITSEAKSFTARAQTAIQAAIDLQEQTGADYVSIKMTPIDKIGCGVYHAAMAEYSPDGGGPTGSEENRVWWVKASDVTLGAEARLVAIAWEEVRDKFEANGEVNIEAMTRYLSGQLNLTPQEVRDYWLECVEMNLHLKQYEIH